MEKIVTEISAEKVVHIPGPATQDSGKVRMGTMSPTFPPVHTKPANLTDGGRLRMGTMSPSFPPGRIRYTRRRRRGKSLRDWAGQWVCLVPLAGFSRRRTK